MQVQKVSDRKAITWLPPSSDSEIIYYMVTYWTDGKQKSLLTSKHFVALGSPFAVTQYVMIRAVSAVGVGPWSEPVQIKGELL